MSRRALSSLFGVGAAVAVLAAPGGAVAKAPVGDCPSSFQAASLFDTPAGFWTAAMQIDKNDDLVVCLKPMANDTRTNVIDNIAHPV